MNDATARFCIAPDHPALAGHFPGNPIVPGVVLLDETLMAAHRAFGVISINGIAQAKFLTPLKPNQAVTVEFNLSATQLKFVLRHGSFAIAQGAFTITL